MTINTINPQSMPFDGRTGVLRTEHFPSQVKFILQLMAKLEHGALCMKFPDGQTATFGDASHPVMLNMKNWEV